MKPSVHAALGEPGVPAAKDVVGMGRPFALRRNLIVIGVLSVVLALLVVLTAIVGFDRAGEASEAASRVREAQRFQAYVDALHDESRADVLSAMLSGAGRGGPSQVAIAADLAENVTEVKLAQAQTESQIHGLFTGLDRAVHQAAQPMNAYFDSATRLVPLAFSDPAAASAQLASFEESYSELEVIEDRLTTEFSDAATRADARTRRAQTQGEGGVIGVGAGAIAVLLSSAVMLHRLGTTNNRLLTRLRESATERAAAGARLDAAQELAHIGSWEVDPQSNEARFSDELYRILGLIPQQITPSLELYWQHVHPDDMRQVRGAWSEQAVAEGKTIDAQYRLLHADGRVRDVHSRATVMLGESGQPVRVSGVVQDVTEQRAVDRMKDEFVSVISHELRTPLTSIRGALGLLAGGALGPLTDKAQHMAEVAVASSERLMRLINDILDVERMEAGELTMQLASCCADDLVSASAREMSAMAADAGVTLRVSSADGSVWADRDRIAQALTNLLSNAIKFSSRGGEVTLSAIPSGGWVKFTVADQGRGIPGDQLDAVFDRFQQVDSSDARDKNGTGLGLPISRGIVEQHGGRIQVTSTPGQGATFSFTLPADVPPSLVGALERQAGPGAY
jgi:PAS domain S-box-containing protein